MIYVLMDLENRRMAYPMDSVANYYTPYKGQLTALPELQNCQPHQSSEQSGILERLPSWYILSLNPSGYGVCRSLIHFNSVLCLLIILNLLVEFAS